MERELEKTLMEIESAITNNEQLQNTHTQSVLEQAQEIIEMCAKAARTPSELKEILERDKPKQVVYEHEFEDSKHMNDGWIPVEDGLPEERNSMFAKWKGTDKWSKSMFEKISGDVNATVEYEDGTRRTITAHTLDGKWALPNRAIKQKVIAWRPLPEPYCPERSKE